MTTPQDVSAFLNEFKAKMNDYSIVYIQRDKNFQALADLDILANDRTRYLQSLEVENYYKGPTLIMKDVLTTGSLV